MNMIESFFSVVQFREYERDRTQRRLSRCSNVDDLRKLAKRRLPGGVFDYIDGAAEDEIALERNSSRFSDIEFVPRVLRDVTKLDTSSTLLGKRLPMPLVLAPTGFTRIADAQGELAVARAAARAGLPYGLSTMGTRSIEEVAEVSDGPKWFQVYTWKDRSIVQSLVERAAASGYEAIVLTVDTTVLGRRERDVRRGFTLPPKIGPETLIDGMLHPEWTLQFLRNEPITFASVKGSGASDGSDRAVSLSQFINGQFDPDLSWDDVAWLKTVWDGPIILKGIQSVADAKMAVDAGVDAVALSNHGGRQLDSAPAPIDLVGPVAEAVGGQIEIICDGGVRRGSDIVKALALGADACMIGRPYLFALGAAGEPGVDWLLNFFKLGLRQTMALNGLRSIDEISSEYVRWR